MDKISLTEELDFRQHIRKIIHVDMDAFYASVEALDHPELRYLPIAVGGSSKRGVVAAASYEARKFGVRSAMSGRLAARLCPDLIFVKPRFERYREISQQIRQIFFEYTDLVEPLSLDEAYLDVTSNKKELDSGTILAKGIRQKIKEKTGLNASAGISINKFLAKIASDINKPNGQKTIPPDEVLDFIKKLDVKKFHGVGKVTQEKMYQVGIFTGEDLRQRSLEELTSLFGKSGLHYYRVVRGIHLSAITTERMRKSLGAERTFNENISSEIYMIERLEQIAEEIQKRLQRNGLAGKTLTLKIKYSDFTVQTRSKTLNYFISSKDLILEEARKLLYQERMKDSVRLLGISLTNFNINSPQKKIKASQLRLPF
ncbi:MAG: DNA polymerase IV [Psychroflexus halocasei]